VRQAQVRGVNPQNTNNRLFYSCLSATFFTLHSSFFTLHEYGLALRRGLVLAALVLQGHAGLDGRVVWVALEGAARGVEAMIFDNLSLKRLRGLELQPLGGRQVFQLVLVLVGVPMFTLRNVNGVERTEALNRHAARALRHLEADLVERRRQDLLHRGAADAAALHHCGNKYAFVFSWGHRFELRVES